MSGTSRVIVIKQNLPKPRQQLPPPHPAPSSRTSQYSVQKRSGYTGSNDYTPRQERPQATSAAAAETTRWKGKAVANVGRKKAPPRPKLTQELLQSKSGVDRLIQELKGMHFSTTCEWRTQEENLHQLMHKYETWGRQLVPQLRFEEFISKLEKLASKKEFRTRVKSVEAGLSFVFDKQVQEELEAGDAMRSMEEREEEERQRQQQQQQQNDESQSQEPPAKRQNVSSLTDEDRKRIETNRQKARERRMAKELERQRAQQQQQDIEIQLQIEQEQEQERLKQQQQ